MNRLLLPTRLPHPVLVLRQGLAAFACGAWLLLAAGAAHAQATNETIDLQSVYQTELRALAMGNAFSPVARGEGALLYNPAGLAQFDFDIKIDATLAAEGEAGDFFTDTVDQFSGSPSTAETEAYLTKYLDTSNFYRAQTFVNVVANLALFNIGLGAGQLDQQRFGFTFTDANADGAFDTNDTLTLDEVALELTVASFALAVLDQQLLLGVTAKDFTFERKTATDTFGNILTANNVELTTVGPSYDGGGVDVGFIWRVASLSFLRAQWSVVGYNVGGITLEAPGAPTLEVPATYNVGLALNPELPFSPVHLILAVEFEDVSGDILVRDANGVDHERSSEQRLHIGAELGFWQTTTGNHILNARVGAHRGLLSYGVELNLFSALRIVYTSYEDDFGHADQEELHTFDAVQITIGFGF